MKGQKSLLKPYKIRQKYDSKNEAILARLSRNVKFVFDRYFYPAPLAWLLIMKKCAFRCATAPFVSLSKSRLRLLSFTDVSTSLLLPLENILRCARTCLLLENASIFIVVNCALTSIYQLCCAPQELAYFFIKKEN